MEAIQVKQIMTKDGEMLLTGLPYKKGQSVEVILLAQTEVPAQRKSLTVRELRRSGLLGMWRERADISDSAVYARALRQQAEQRGVIQE
ncbi:MAG: hypothetical protein KF753_04180 [Caldilineaceae bacterium]|nr:hypothetical protein [Caldilineaceae bacterium]